MWEEYTVLDLFPGIGSMSLAAQMAGFRIKSAAVCNGEKRLKKLYHINFNLEPVELPSPFADRDSIGDFASQAESTDIIVGRLPASLFADGQNNLLSIYYEKVIKQLLWEKTPRAFVFSFAKKLENTLKNYILDNFSETYRVYCQLLDSREITGAPVQDRKIYMVGIRKDIGAEFGFSRKPYGSVSKIQSFLQREGEELLYRINEEDMQLQHEADLYIYKKGTYIPGDHLVYSYIKRPLVHSASGIRKISNREMARTKGFPDEFFLDNNWSEWVYRRICDSVNVLTAYQVFEQLQRVLRDSVGFVPKRQSVSIIEPRKSLSEETTEKTEETFRPEVPQKRIFLSYCHNEREIADLIENRLMTHIKDDFYISRDVRDVGYRESFRSFMRSVRDHEFVIMLISDSYIKSVNCMYEMTEIFKDPAYGKKLLFIVLQDQDQQYCRNEAKNRIGAQIYDLKKIEEYLLYWQKREKEVSDTIQRIGDPVLTGNHVEELKKIQTFKLNLEDFFRYLRDSRGLALHEHIESDFLEIRRLLYMA